MKVEEAEGTVMPLESIPPAADLAPTENLPCHNHLNEGRLLRDLDDAIVLFEMLIYHSDAGFHAWREHHKEAMEAGLAEVPTYPYLQRRTRDGERTWNDDVWEQRYFYLVYHRQHIIMERLSRLPALPRYAREDFFGSYPAPHRATLNKRGKGRYTRPLKLRCDWWRSVDFLLERASLRWGMDAAALKATFWADEFTSSVKKQAPEWEGAMRGEDQAGVSTRKEKIESLEDAVGLAANVVSGALCFASG